MNKNIEEKVIFGVSPGAEPMILLGVPKGAWEYMKDGKTHTFDLTKIGLPLKIVMYGAENHTAAMKIIEGHMSAKGQTYADERRRDFSIYPTPKEQD
jgi:hypothetical protein